jgi:hypothetical protein
VDVGAGHRRSVERWAVLVAGASGDWSGPTPCNEWDVRQLVNHVVYEDRWTKPLMEGKTIAEVGDAFEGDLLDDAPTEAAQTAAQEAIDSVDERWPLGGKVHLSYGEEDLSEYISQLLADHTERPADRVRARPRLATSSVDRNLARETRT